jgi:hypothetical protein
MLIARSNRKQPTAAYDKESHEFEKESLLAKLVCRADKVPTLLEEAQELDRLEATPRHTAKEGRSCAYQIEHVGH